MLGNVTQPFDAGGFEFGMRVEASLERAVGRQAAGDSAGDERGTLFLQRLDQLPLLPHQCVQPRRLAVEKVRDLALLASGRPSIPEFVNVIWISSLMTARDGLNFRVQLLPE